MTNADKSPAQIAVKEICRMMATAEVFDGGPLLREVADGYSDTRLDTFD